MIKYKFHWGIKPFSYDLEEWCKLCNINNVSWRTKDIPNTMHVDDTYHLRFINFKDGEDALVFKLKFEL
jgi:hypothetical protein